MTYWVDNHPGGPDAIKEWSQNNGTILVFPSLLESNPHSMSRWNNNWNKFTYVGRFGDTQGLSDLPSTLRGADVIDYFGTTERNLSNNALVCGSPGEVANDKSEGLKFDILGGVTSNIEVLGNNRKFVWIMIVLGAPDQLRQRVSWAMSQVSIIFLFSVAYSVDLTQFFQTCLL